MWRTLTSVRFPLPWLEHLWSTRIGSLRRSRGHLVGETGRNLLPGRIRKGVEPLLELLGT